MYENCVQRGIMPLQLEAYYDAFFQSFLITLEIYVVALVIGFLLGLFLALERVYGNRVLSRVATAYIEIIRGTPLLTQLLLVYFSLPALNSFLESQGMAGIPLNWIYYYYSPGRTQVVYMSWGILASIIALGLNSAAYQAEYFRGAIVSLSSGQVLAAMSLGLTRNQTIRYVILPQSLRRVIPSWSNEAAYLPKYTVAAYFVGVTEIFNMAKYVAAKTFISLPVYLIVTAAFVVLITAISSLLDYIYRHTRIPGL